MLHKVDHEGDKSAATKLPETAILIAAKNGVLEIVERILENFPTAIHDMNEEKKNIALLAVEHRQTHVYNYLCTSKSTQNSNIFQQVDNDGNSILHFAAKLPKETNPWPVFGAALQMQWEIKWFKVYI